MNQDQLANHPLGKIMEAVKAVTYPLDKITASINRVIPKLPRSMLGTNSLVGAASFVPAGFRALAIPGLDNFGAVNNLQRILDKTITPVALPPAMRSYLGATTKFQGVRMHLAPIIHIPRFRELDKLWPLLDQMSGPGSKVEVVQRGLLSRQQAQPIRLLSPIVRSEPQSSDHTAAAQIHALFDWLAADLAALRQDFAELRTNAGDARARMEAKLLLIEGLLELPFLAFAHSELNEEKRQCMRVLQAMLSALKP